VDTLASIAGIPEGQIMYSTKTTWLGNEYGCWVFHNGMLVVEGRAQSRQMIGPVFRDLLRTIDKCGGNQFTSAARHRASKNGNVTANVKHIWSEKWISKQVVIT